MIIKNLSLRTNDDENIVIKLERIFPTEYPADARFVIERYSIPTDSEELRRELQDVVKSQTVLQYMSDNLMMSAEFQLVPSMVTWPMDSTVKYGDLGMAAIFIDITEDIKQGATEITDTESNLSMLHLYRIVYTIDETVYSTPYVAGYERIDGEFSADNTESNSFKAFIDDGTMLRNFGENWRNLKLYWGTISENNKNAAIDPKSSIYKLPGRRVNFRFKGPLEDRKLKVSYNEAARHIRNIERITSAVNSEITATDTLFKNIGKSMLNAYTTSDGTLDVLRIEIEKAITHGLIAMIVRTGGVGRILSKSRIGESLIIPDTMRLPGLYIFVDTIENANIINNLLDSGEWTSVEELIFIYIEGSTEPVYTVNT